jgi:succinate dehydrogenase / fumarate reductase membrane anchor subunit
MVRYAEFGAHHPLRDWLTQRMTAVVMALYSVIFLIMLLVMSPVNYPAWCQIFLPSWMKFATLLFFVSLYLHAWIGMRNICMDYIKHARARQVLYALMIGALVAYTAWTVQILWEQ